MKPPPFEYHSPQTLAEALELRSSLGEDGVALAGGQSLLPLLSMRLARPGALIDLGRIDSLAGIDLDDGVLSIGAMTRQREAERSEQVQSTVPLIGQALAHVASPSIRNCGTIGGSIAHSDGASELPAAAVALDAEVVVQSTGGQRVISAEDFFLGAQTTALQADELLTELRFRGRNGTAGSAFVEVARRRNSPALVGVAALVELATDGTIDDARLVFSGVSATPVRARAAEAVLAGQKPSEELSGAAAAQGADALDPVGDVHAPAAYRRRVAAALGRRALDQAVAAAQHQSAA